jgi:hypothetical protein
LGKKAKLYLLVVINLAVWGYVFHKVYGALQGDDETDFAMDQTGIKKIEPVVKGDSIRLMLNYEDPFLKHGNFSSGKPKQNVTTAPSKSPASPQPVVKAVVTPTAAPSADIKYLGLIKSSMGGAMTALLSINGKSSFVKQNESIEGFVVKEISAESILLLKGKEKLLIRK